MSVSKQERGNRTSTEFFFLVAVWGAAALLAFSTTGCGLFDSDNDRRESNSSEPPPSPPPRPACAARSLNYRSGPTEFTPSEWELLQDLKSLTPSFCQEDCNNNGAVDALDFLNIAKSRIAWAPMEMAASAREETATELLNDRIASLCPEWKSEAQFTKVMFKVGQALGPAPDFLYLADHLSTGKKEVDINKVIGPVIGIISPDTPCVDKGIAQCGKDISDAVEAMGDDIRTKTYSLTGVKVTVGDTTVDLSGKYDESALRALAAAASLVHASFYFIAAHVDINTLIAQISNLLPAPPSLDFDTAGQFLNTLNAFAIPLTTILDGAIKNKSAGEQLSIAKESTRKAIEWLNGAGGSQPAIVYAIERSTDKDLVLRFVDGSQDGRFNGCDILHLRPGLLDGLLPDPQPRPASTGCVGGTTPVDLQLPLETPEHEPIDYARLFQDAAIGLGKMAEAVSNKSIPVMAEHINPLIAIAGRQPLGPFFQLFPSVIFEEGLSVLTPAIMMNGTEKTLALEAEIGRDAPACPEGKTPKGDWICKNRKGDRDWSNLITKGDSNHFENQTPMEKDGIFLSGALSDPEPTESDSLFLSAGRDYLPYAQLKDPDLKGFAKVADTLLGELSDPSVDVCARQLGKAASGSFVNMDTRTLNALVNYVLIKTASCGESRVTP